MKKTLVFAAAAALGLAGCATTGGPAVQYQDTRQAEQLTGSFGRTDLQLVAEQMVQSLVADPVVQGRPIVVIATVRNKTSEEIDTKALTDKIRVALIKSGKVHFLAAESRDEQMAERDYQQASGNVDAATAAEQGKERGAKYQLTGEVVSIVKRTADRKDVYYKFTLNLVNLTTGDIDWADEKEISKLVTRRSVGM